MTRSISLVLPGISWLKTVESSGAHGRQTGANPLAACLQAASRKAVWSAYPDDSTSFFSKSRGSIAGVGSISGHNSPATACGLPTSGKPWSLGPPAMEPSPIQSATKTLEEPNDLNAIENVFLDIEIFQKIADILAHTLIGYFDANLDLRVLL
jgi:hypothetical protein